MVECRSRVFFFFSSRRRHTRLQGDWSSDVCSSDLVAGHRLGPGVGDGDQRLRQIRRGETDRLEHGARRRAVRPVEENAALVAGIPNWREAGGGREEDSVGAASLLKKKKKKRSI